MRPTRGKWCVTAFGGFPRGQGYSPPGVNFTTCAIVGNSDALKKKERGAEIDAHSVVIRFNEAPTVGYATHTHTHTHSSPLPPLSLFR